MYKKSEQMKKMNKPEIRVPTIKDSLQTADITDVWKKDTSFIEVMEDFYKRVRAKGLSSTKP